MSVVPSGTIARPLPARWRARLRRWWVAHDDRLGFTLLYLGLAVVLSLAIGLFWLIAVVAAHAALEHWALGRRRYPGPRWPRVLWHMKLDIALVLFALCLAVYLDLIFGAAGIGAAARVGAQAGSRFIAWQKAIRGALLSLDDAALLARSLVRGGNGQQTPVPAAELRPWAHRWPLGDRLSLALGGLFGGLLLLGPWLSGHDLAGVVAILGAELHPFPGTTAVGELNLATD